MTLMKEVCPLNQWGKGEMEFPTIMIWLITPSLICSILNPRYAGVVFLTPDDRSKFTFTNFFLNLNFHYQI